MLRNFMQVLWSRSAERDCGRESARIVARFYEIIALSILSRRSSRLFYYSSGRCLRCSSRSFIPH